MPPRPLNRDDALLLPHEVATMFGVHRATVGRWARLGMLIHVRTPGGQRRYRLGDVLAAGAEQRRIEADAVRLYLQGWNIHQVAERFEWSYSKTRRILGHRTTLRPRGNRGRNGDSMTAPAPRPRGEMST